MTLEKVYQITKGIPVMSPEQGRTLYNFLLDNTLANVLELGVYHGVSTCYTAAAIDELGQGRVVSVDNQIARNLNPDADTLLGRLGLRHLVDLHFEQHSYTWFLLRHLRDTPEKVFDFCYLDGAHTWDTDGFAFFLVDKCLRPGGWILFDDLDWCFATCETLKDTAFLRDVLKDPEFLSRMSREEQETKQIRAVWELLVTQHPEFDEFVEDGPWGFARKAKHGTSRRTLLVRKESGIWMEVARLCRRAARSLRRR